MSIRRTGGDAEGAARNRRGAVWAAAGALAAALTLLGEPSAARTASLEPSGAENLSAEALYQLDRWRGDGGATRFAEASAAAERARAAQGGGAGPQERAQTAHAMLGAWRATGDARFLTAAASAAEDARDAYHQKGASTPGGWAIAAFADAAEAFGAAEWRYSATAAAEWALREPNEDAAWRSRLGLGLIALWHATGERDWLRTAAEIARMQARADAPDRAEGLAAALELMVAVQKRAGALGAPHDSLSPAINRLAAIAEERAPRAAEAERPLLLKAAATARRGETGARRALAYGLVAASLQRTGPDSAMLTLRVAPGWHVTAPEPGARFLTPLKLMGPALAEARFPKSKTLHFDSLGLTVNTLGGRIEAPLRLTTAEGGPVSLTLTLQACSDEICLPPEKTLFRL